MKNNHILLIEDNSDDEALAIRALLMNKVTNDVAVARDGVEALNYLFGDKADLDMECKQRPDLILLDLKLPKVDGLEVLRHLRANEATKCLPVVIMSSSSEEKDIVSSYKLGANSYIRKPVDFKKFSDAVAQIGAYWLELNEIPNV